MNFHRLSFFLFLLLLMLPPAGVAQKQAEDLHLFLCIGQSNMAGRAPLLPEDSNPIPGCMLFNKEGEWEPAIHPLNRHSSVIRMPHKNRFGPAGSFAQTLLQQHPDLRIGLVVNARGSTRIEQWKKGSQYYNAALRRAKEAQKHGTLKAILWHQGESDAKKPEGYAEALATLVTDLRADLGQPDLPFLAGEVSHLPAINQQIRELTTRVPKNTAVVSAKGLTKIDKAHFDRDSAIELGKRYGRAYLELTESPR